jgi:hypothetical protein
MSLRNWTPCDEPDLEGRHHCPYAEDGDYVNCEWYCGAEEPEDYPEEYEEYEEDELDYEEEMEEEDGWDKREYEPSRDDWDDC